ncbi:MAG: hypothetical protein K940chlam3_00312 [Chlamydiae bacterium]|nr:hypothetical protein [Chlamydiota bacterium]
MSLISKLDHNFHQFQEKQEHDAAGYGLKQWLYSFPHEQYEKNALDLVREISQKVSSGDQDLNNQQLKDLVNKLFFKVVPSLESGKGKVAIYETIAQNKELQNFLDADLRKNRHDKLMQPHLVHDSDHRINRKIAKARFALKLGYGREAAGSGMSGSEFLRGVNGKRLGLFKVSTDRTSLWKRIHDGFLKYFIFNQPYYLKAGPKSGIQAEEAAYIVSSKAGFGKLVPPTRLATFDGVEGSFQLMAKKEIGEKIAEFDKIKDKFESRDNYTNNEIEMFQKFAVYDYLINNLDRHHGNWMVEYTEKNGSPELKRIHAIDHDRGFSLGNPSGYTLGGKSQYLWRTLKIARHEMTPETKKFIQQNLRKREIDKVVQEIEEKVTGFMSQEMKDRIYEKAEVLIKMAHTSGTLEELGAYRNDHSIRGYLNL